MTSNKCNTGICKYLQVVRDQLQVFKPQGQSQGQVPHPQGQAQVPSTSITAQGRARKFALEGGGVPFELKVDKWTV